LEARSLTDTAPRRSVATAAKAMPTGLLLSFLELLRAACAPSPDDPAAVVVVVVLEAESGALVGVKADASVVVVDPPAAVVAVVVVDDPEPALAVVVVVDADPPAVVAVVAEEAGCVVAVVAGVGTEPPTTWTTAFMKGCGSQW
jgi:hypothetical protein